MGKKKTHQEFIKEMQIKHPNLEILNQYFNSKTRIKYKCHKCGLVWDATASKLSFGRGCPQCAGNRLKSHDEYVKQVAKINPGIKICSQYISTSHKVSFECKKCGYTWKTKPGSVLRGKGCYLCGKKSMGDKLRKTHQAFVNEMGIINSNIIILGDYQRDDIKILCRCNICNNEWYATPSSLHAKHGCPNCSFSKGEKDIEEYLQVHKIKYIPQYKFSDLLGVGGNKLSYDFYLPEYNILIEYQGKQHKQPIDYFGGEQTFKRQKEHDMRKREYAFQHNIKLLEIWYYENINDKLEQTLNLKTVTTTGY